MREEGGEVGRGVGRAMRRGVWDESVGTGEGMTGERDVGGGEEREREIEVGNLSL